MKWKFFATDVECIEGICSVGAVFEQVFLGLGKFLAGLVFAEAVAATADARGLYGEYQVLVVRAVEERHQALLTCEALVDEQVLLVVSHRVSDVHGLAAPALPLELVDFSR